ncbi:MAG: class I SAM-dependent methyltransferase, partial [Treponema sp.]|nr:class I SAM-dependent methyltransferase [Treponema sp.]
VAMVDVLPEDKVLDIGFGNGHLLKGLYRKLHSDLYGIDISEDMVRQATKRNAAAFRQGKLHLQIGDCCDLPFEDNFFAAATSINTVYFWKDTVKGLSEIRRVLKPGGAFFNVVYTKESLDKLAYTRTGFKKFVPEQLLEAGKAAGFDDIHVKDIVEGESFAVVCRK